MKVLTEQFTLTGMDDVLLRHDRVSAKNPEKITSTRLAVLPRSSKDINKVTLATKSGLTGSALSAFKAESEHRLMLQGLSVLNGAVASGQYTGKSIVRSASGDITMTIKRSLAPVVVVTDITKCSVEELAAEIARRQALVK